MLKKRRIDKTVNFIAAKACWFTVTEYCVLYRQCFCTGQPWQHPCRDYSECEQCCQSSHPDTHFCWRWHFSCSLCQYYLCIANVPHSTDTFICLQNTTTQSTTSQFSVSQQFMIGDYVVPNSQMNLPVQGLNYKAGTM